MQKKISVIIPHRDSLNTLSRLLRSIPSSDDIEVLVVDNSPIAIMRDSVGSSCDYRLLFSPPEKGAGGARNVGIENATGKWLVFADADDYFADDAFNTFLALSDSPHELIYFLSDAVFSDTGLPSDRVDSLNHTVKNFISGEIEEMRMRLGFPTPWAKMVAHDLVKRHSIRFDEVVACNDVYFSMLAGYYAKTIDAVDKVVYVATVTKGSLSHRRGLSIVDSRLRVALRYNRFVKDHNYPQYQISIMLFLKQTAKFGIKALARSCSLLIEYRQNPFIGAGNWFKTYFRVREKEKKEKDYITT